MAFWIYFWKEDFEDVILTVIYSAYNSEFPIALTMELLLLSRWSHNEPA